MGGCNGREGPDALGSNPDLFMIELRGRSLDKYLLMAIKVPDEICLSMPSGNEELIVELDAVMKDNCAAATRQDDIDGTMWDYSWKYTKFTSGYSFFGKSWLPQGKTIVKVLDVLAKFGWTLTDGPNFGGVDSQVDACWPVLIFQRDTNVFYTNENLFITVDGTSTPGKLYVAGSASIIEELETDFVQENSLALTKGEPGVSWDALWENIDITTASSFFSANSNYPKGRKVHRVLEGIYKFGWRLVGAPNFGGSSANWPCLSFRRLRPTLRTPQQLLLVSVMNRGIFFTGCLAQESVLAIREEIRCLPGNNDVKESNDDDWDAVLRQIAMTGAEDSSPRGDIMMAMFRSLTSRGLCTVSCINFGTSGAIWPTFVLEKRWGTVEPAFVAILDSKVCIGGADDAIIGIRDGFKNLIGERVEQGKDSGGSKYDVYFTNTIMTNGKRCPLSGQRSWWPYGYPLEMLLSEFYEAGFIVVGGPNFGSQGECPGIVFHRRIVKTSNPEA